MIRIENGCNNVTIDTDPMPVWRYEYEDNEGDHYVFFTTAWGYIPKIGDSIDEVGHSLIPLEGYIINNDPGFQRRDFDDGTWPQTFKG